MIPKLTLHADLLASDSATALAHGHFPATPWAARLASRASAAVTVG
jgi:hypothetical protein